MSERRELSDLLEPERYEIHSGPAYSFTLGRRRFFQAFGSGIFVVLAFEHAPAQESGGGRQRRTGEATPDSLEAWIHIGEDSTVTVFTGKAEVGQDIRTSLSQVVADELGVPIDSVRLVMGDTDLTPYDMGTFGSRTSPIMAPQLRRAAAAAREMLLELAAGRWNVERSGLTVESGRIRHPDGSQALTFGELTGGRTLVRKISSEIPTRPADQWTVSGKPARKVNARELVTGRHRYASDQKRPGMLVGKVLRAPAWNSTLQSVDTGRARTMDGVTVVHDGSFVGVAARDEAAALRALEAIEARWEAPTGQPSSSTIFEFLKAHPAEARGFGGSSRPGRGSVEEGMAMADHEVEAVYTVAYIAHAPLEPRAALAEWNGEKLTVWTGTQRPFGVRPELAGAFRIPEDRVRVIVPDTGSAYGGKHSGEVAVEAARLAKAAGRPVRLVWTREEEFAWAYFRPAGVIEVRSGARKDGSITAWDFHNYNSGGAAIAPVYDIPNQRVEFHGAQSPLRQGSYRALAATANHFARESHLDELAHAVGADPLDFRLKNLKDARLKAVLEAAAERFGWRTRRPGAGRAFGMAGGFEKGSYVATFVEIERGRGSRDYGIVRIVVAFECGAILNPDHLRSQVEGMIVQGLGGALFERIDFEDGRIRNGRFSQYRVPRFSDTPPIETVLLDRKDLPSAGGGETPIVAVAPAVANAIFRLSGERIRSLPLL